MNRQVVGLYSMLSTGEYMTAESLAQTLHVSSKTVRNHLKNLDCVLAGYDAHVESKHGKGYRLVAEDPGKLRILEDRLWNRELQQPVVPNSSEERVRYLLDYLLGEDEYVKLDNLSELLYISKKTLTGNLKEVEAVLKEYRLKLSRKPNYGIRVEGKEFDRRLCIAENKRKRAFLEEQLNGGTRMTEEVCWLHDNIQDCLSRYSFTVSNVAYQDLVLNIQIAVRRIQGGHYIKEGEIGKKPLDQAACRLAQDLLERIREKYQVSFPYTEADCMAVHFEGRKTLLKMQGIQGEEAVAVTQEVSDLVDYMLDALYGAFRFDFRNDMELRTSLGLHLVPLVVRLQHDMKLKNPLLQEIKERYSLSYTMATTACLFLSHKYHKPVDEDEVGYIALLFALALERERKGGGGKKILLVCALGKASGQLMLYQYKTEFGAYLDSIDVCDVSQIGEYNFADIDYIFTAVPIRLKLPVPVYEVEYFLKGADVLAVKRTLQGRYDHAITDIYREELFLPHMDFRDKGEALRSMCGYVHGHGLATETLVNSILAREAVARTFFGNMVAMPHPVEMTGEQPFVCIALLDEPIQWLADDPESMVQAIFLVSVANGTGYDAQLFYQVTTRLFLDGEGMKELVRNQDFGTLKALLAREEREVEAED